MYNLDVIAEKDNPSDSPWFLSLSRLVGPIKDVIVTVSIEFGDPVLAIHKVVLENGQEFDAEGEHDLPYLIEGYKNGKKFNIISTKSLRMLREQLENA
jgi:hypothetical protein